MSEEIKKEDQYTIDQIMDAIIQADSEIIAALQYRDRDMLRDALLDFLS